MTGMLVLLSLLVGTVVATPDLTNGVYDREHEPNPRELQPFKMADVIRNICENVRSFMDEKRSVGVKPRNAMELSNVLVVEFDGDRDGCISNNEIRDIAARFRGDLTGYRTLFQHILDENKNGCTEPEELNALILDCTMPSAGVMKSYPNKYTIPFNGHEQDVQDSEEDTAIGEEEVEEEEEEEEEMNVVEEEGEDILDPEFGADEQADRRQILEQERATQQTALNPAVKEMICSMFRREHEDAVFGIKLVKEIVDVDGDDIMSFNELYELLAGARIPREESNELAAVIDTDGDATISTEELLEAVDYCPLPDPIHIPVVNTRPIIHTEDALCPSQSAMYVYLRSLAMKFLGTRGISFGEVRDVAQELYISITGDIEQTITPANLDVPMHCVKDLWRDVDANNDGFLDLFEFNRIALDILEEFLPRPTKRINRIQNTRLDASARSPIEDVPRDTIDILADAAISICREMGIALPETDMLNLVNILYQDTSTAALLDKISAAPVTEEGLERLASVIRPIIHQLQQH